MKYFEMSEFDCKCGCGKNNINPDLLGRLDRAREKAGVPFIINSGCRCESHNKNVGGSPTSPHLDGFAADIKVTGSGERFTILAALLTEFNRVGIGGTFIHVDSDHARPVKVVWVYK